jgi:putative salt-induced outer membrane protein YdiY|tara:strand:- start:110 stop:775 length:666 start_codon:yes stop_codon:yes gene_type:complete
MTTRSKIHLSILTLAATLLLSFKASAQTEISGGGDFFNVDEDVQINLDFDHRQELENGWQYVVEADFYTSYADSDKRQQSLYTNWKLNKDINEKTYVLAVFQTDADKFRDYSLRTVAGVGYGYKVFKNDKWKISTESSVAYLDAMDKEVILRSSLWVAYKATPNLTLTNKVLHENSDAYYLRVETELNYAINDKFSIGIANEYTYDYEKESILMFNFSITL